MKSMHTLGALLLATSLGGLAGCFPTRTDGLQCQITEECGDGYSCQTGYCLPSSVTAPDGNMTMVDVAPPSEACEDEWPGETTLFDPCDIGAPGDTALVLNSPGVYELNTTNFTLTGPSAVSASIALAPSGLATLMSVKSLEITNNATLRVVGDKPLIIASWTTINITNGTIDVSSGTTPAAGAIAVGTGACTSAVPTAGNGNGAGGGAGGGFGTAGGTGGNGGNGGNGGTGGAAIAARSVPELAGGCGGQPGAGNNPGTGGAGGGAVWLVAKNLITIGAGGTINAAGAGGGGATNGRSAGGGGGSGGMIGLESMMITNAGVLTANGGSGGQGEDDGTDGNAGAAGTLSTTAAVGGGFPNNENGGGFGGDGSALAAPKAGNNGVNNEGGQTHGGGGGGGGGAGYIVVSTPNAFGGGGTIAPQFTTRQFPQPE